MFFDDQEKLQHCIVALQILEDLEKVGIELFLSQKKPFFCRDWSLFLDWFVVVALCI